MPWWKPSTWFRSGVEALALEAPARPRELTRLRYDGAKRDHLTSAWIAGDGDASSEIGPDLARLRQRAREAERNRGLATRILDLFESTVIGAVGARPRFFVTSRSGAELPGYDSQLADVWRAWAKEASAADRLTFQALQALALRSIVRDGEILGRLRPRRLEDVASVPLQIELLEADHLDTLKNLELPNGGRIVNGVESDAIGRVVAYWVFRRHPGDRTGIGMIDAVRVPAESIVHPFRATRAGQRRGVTWLAPVLDEIWHHTELRRAERVRFRASACTFATVSGANDDGDDGINPVEPMDGEEAGPTGYVEDADGNPVNQMVPGLIANVTHGKELTLHTPNAAVGYADAIRVEERDIARGVGLMYEALSGDLSSVNWASFRVGDVRFRALVDMIRSNVLEPLFLDPIVKVWLDFGLASGRITIPPGASVRVEWRWLPHEEMDREASAKADIAEMRAGGTTFEQFCERRGSTMAEQIASHKRSIDALTVAGVILDGIPAQTTNGGMTQQAPPLPA